VKDIDSDHSAKVNKSSKDSPSRQTAAAGDMSTHARLKHAQDGKHAASASKSHKPS
jgi:hypothetical protein